MIIDLSLNNQDLYKGLEIETVAGRLNLVGDVNVAVSVVGTNIHNMVAALDVSERDEVELTGPMAVWAYLVVFHAVVHRFKSVYYNDGRNGRVLVAKHG